MNQLLALNIGNTHIQIGVYASEELNAQYVLEKHELDKLNMLMSDAEIILTGSVNPALLEQISPMLINANADVFEVEKDINVPIGRKVDPKTKVGVDRLLNAAAAFDKYQQSCVVIDIGTAITVDFVDGEGTFHGGAISPGIQLMLDCLTARTSELPTVDFMLPQATFGDNTKDAMCLGAYAAARGQVQFLVERYAESIGHFPKVVATGGQCEHIFTDDMIVEHVVPELTLNGLKLAFDKAAESQ